MRFDNNVLSASALFAGKRPPVNSTAKESLCGHGHTNRDLGCPGHSAEPVAFAAHRTFLIAFISGAIFSLLVSLGAALSLANALKKRFDAFNENARDCQRQLRKIRSLRFRIAEIDELSLSMQRMANSVLERESRLKQNEEKLSSIPEGAADAIFITDQHGRYHYVKPFGHHIAWI